jgi:ATP-dependent RNA helicase DDX19/DBP5
MEAGQEVITLNAEEGETVYASKKTWENFDIPEGILSNIRRLGWTQPTLIQSVALGPIKLNKRNLVAQSKNGTGKTGAFVIGSLTGAMSDFEALQIICLSNTRELNRQNFAVFQELTRETPFRVGIVEAGIHEIPHCHVLCATIGALQNVIRIKVKTEDAKQTRRRVLQEVKVFIVDEADTMFEGAETLEVVKALMQELPPACQKLLFSATYTDNVREFIGECITNAITIKVERVEDLNLDNVKQFVLQCEHDGKYEAVLNIIRQVIMKTCIIFVNTKEFAKGLQRFLKERDHTVEIFAGGLKTNEERDEILEKLKRGEVKILISTNVLSRGVDIRMVNLVINLDIPFKHETGEPDHVTYLHRIGRTGRYGRKGIAVNVISDTKSQRGLMAIQNVYQSEIKSISVEELAKEVAGIDDDYAQ